MHTGRLTAKDFVDHVESSFGEEARPVVEKITKLAEVSEGLRKKGKLRSGELNLGYYEYAGAEELEVVELAEDIGRFPKRTHYKPFDNFSSNACK